MAPILMTQMRWVIGLLQRMARCASDTLIPGKRSAVVKLTHMLLVRRMAKSQEALSRAVRHLLCSMDKAGIISQANQMVASDTVQQETPAQLLSGLAKPKRRFNIAALAKYMRNGPSEAGPSSAKPLAQCSETSSREPRAGERVLTPRRCGVQPTDTG